MTNGVDQTRTAQTQEASSPPGELTGESGKQIT